MVPIVIGKCDYSYFLEFGYSFFIVGAKPHSSAALSSTHKIAFWTPKRLHQNLGHFGLHPLPPDQNVLIFNYKKIRFSS